MQTLIGQAGVADVRMLSLPVLPVPPVPNIVHVPPRRALATLLNQVFSTAIKEGELDWLDGRLLALSVSGIEFSVTLHNETLRVAGCEGVCDLRVSGSLHDFMLLAARREDADTLFFQRRLKTEGDTELGLHLKNFLDAQDLSDLPYGGLLDKALCQAIDLHERLSPLRRRIPI